MKPIIKVKNLKKEFVLKIKRKGILKNFFTPEKKIMQAVNNISFEVDKGEILAFIGPNGAGKSTTIKILSGILHPSSGDVEVLGYNPQKERQKLSFKTGTVFGQRSQLIFNLPAVDSFSLFGRIYELSKKEIEKRQKEVIELLEIEDLVFSPVRKLSLGQRMRAEIALALIHRPEIIFLDEPTIGLDIIAKRKLREILLKLNREEGVTIFLTSHDVGDIETICRRTIIVNHGKIITDMKTDEIKKKYLTEKLIDLKFKNKIEKIKIDKADVISFSGTSAKLKIDTKKNSLNKTIEEIITQYDLDDIDVHNASMEDIISSIYEDKETKKN